MSAYDDAVELVIWYESQPSCQTRKTDAQIAELLRWFQGGASRSAVNRRLSGGKFAEPDKARVRKARRFVDRSVDGLFEDYQFGTRRSGTKMETVWSRLSRRGVHSDESDVDAMAQIGTARKREEQHQAELARIIDKCEHMAREFASVGKIEKAFAMSAAAADYRSDGKLRKATEQMLADVGLLEAAA